MPASDSDNLKPPPKTADAVAVALATDKTGDADGERPPKVIAGGRGRVAEQILEVAFAHGIKVREDADLVELLAAIDMDSEIPLDAFAAVAEILTYVYEANQAMDADGNSDAPPSKDELVARWSNPENTEPDTKDTE